MGIGIREVLSCENLEVGAIVRRYFPEARREVAVLWTWHLVSTRTVMQLRFELQGGPPAHFVDVFAFTRFVVAVERVLADAVVEGA
jgi:hypothetical protein